MMIDELIEKLYELKREHGDQEIKLFTQNIDQSWHDHNFEAWEAHDVDEVYFSDELYFCKGGAIVIQGKENTEE